MEVTGKKTIKSLIQAVVTSAALTMDYSLIADERSIFGYINPETPFVNLSKLFYSIEAPKLTSFLLTGFLLCFYMYLNDMKELPGRHVWLSGFLAGFASFCAVTGKLFYVYNDIWLFTYGTVQILKGLFVIIGMFMLFFALIKFVVWMYTRYCGNIATVSSDHITTVLFHGKYAGILIALFLLAAWMPTIIAYYPAVFMGDSEDIIYMAYNYPPKLENLVLPLKEGVYITNHHPVLYTGYISLILHIVKALGGSWNFGIFLCAMIQCLITVWVLAYSCMYCAKQLKNGKFALAAVLFYALLPWVPKYAIMISKDTFFADLLLLWAILIHKAANTGNGKKDIAGLAVTSAGIVLFRKNGIYVIVLTLFLAMVLYKRFWKRWFLVLAAVMAVNVLYSNVMLPVMGIPDGSIREMLSIPFQQTARYVKYHTDEVTEEERHAIENVLDYDNLARKYSGGLSDPVKNSYKEEATGAELKAYFAVWFRMFWKHPEEYAAAFLHNYYGYFYPVVNDAMKLARTSVGSMANVNRDGYFGFSHCEDRFHTGFHDILTFYDLLWMRIPVLNMLMTSALYVWVVIAAFFLNLIRKDRACVLAAFMYLALLLTVLVGPSNAINYERYVFPCILGMPFLVTMTLTENEWSAKNV